jgi:AraC-like DNA-binding protein
MTGPRLYRPRPPLADHIEYFGYWERGSTIGAHTSRALPRGAATVIIHVGDGNDLGFYASDGATRLSVPPAFIVGPGVASYVTRVQVAQTVMTIHFRPAGARPFVGCPLGELENACAGLADLWGSDAESLLDQLNQTDSARRRVDLLEAFLLDRMRSQYVRPQPEVASVMVAAELNPSMRVSKAHDLTGLSAKRFNALFRSRVGLSPKAYLRVRRLQAALRALDTAAPGALIAADLGYFDQAHFVREFQGFAAITPTQYAQRRSSMPGHVEINETPPEFARRPKNTSQAT